MSSTLLMALRSIRLEEETIKALCSGEVPEEHRLDAADVNKIAFQFCSRRPTRDDPNRVNDARDVAQDRQEDVEPELPTQSNGEEHTDRRQQNGKQNAQKIGHGDALRGGTMG
jgi:hypothetical protein